MPIKNYKSTRAARKKMSIVDRRELHKGQPHKALTHGRKRLSGRGSAGKITIRHRGGGAKRLNRKVDFGQDKLAIPARVERLEFDPIRSAHLALIMFVDGVRRYVVAWEGAKAGDTIERGEKALEKPGNRKQLKDITPGVTVFNVEMMPGRGGKMLRSAGSYGTIMDVQGEYAQLQLASGEVRLIAKESYATIGKVSNPDHWLQRIGSAGRSRRLGRRPQVRGKVMNPVDHPHGGGEGAQPIGLKAPKTKWGKPALGVKTRQKRRYSDNLILERRNRKK
ncbi:MAG: 50S ribosomal protein L2 [Candidatus Andersenbacteria bacterium]|nr:50S ribosomal protein L2 [Candidatus Andersenbacteria bacterium]MBI3251044.1 50S ribosomal protein L2 [Candidatus Andersenbacteria bacterium]